ncbi:MAG: hypothetical protein H6867_08940 [Rhodospirillales bacterium]|nr:hypothetical protein [Rhodospirillales bacterium]MCB9996069.1 hypothetical protein [Rhodospirillales bacterium]
MLLPQHVKPAKPTILCMFSGGLDSFGCAWQLFTNDAYKDFHIHLHHMHIVNVEQRTQNEEEATRRFVTYCEQEFRRDFTFTENIMGFRFLQSGDFPMDSYLYGFVSAMIANNNPNIVHVAVGRTKTDMENDVPLYPHIQRGHRIFEASLTDERQGKITYIFPVRDISKNAIYEALPPRLQQSFWSCRRPVNLKPCHQCETCRALAALNIEHPDFT